MQLQQSPLINCSLGIEFFNYVLAHLAYTVGQQMQLATIFPLTIVLLEFELITLTLIPVIVLSVYHQAKSYSFELECTMI